jgi:tetratricopeptide (TPR) repeat protein
MNMKKLRPTTIVPDSLYVERAADRQLRTVVEDMGRPGYILVARQMGKTNLLLHMKRERWRDLVLYLDLSNRFDSAQGWFRNVIDSLLEASPDELSALQPTIVAQRDTNSLSPSAEFDRHLRMILKSTRKRIIIILDEIDSLVNTTYSDVILSQIRSMYFSRESFPEYLRLTYVLSGVAEPTDLIKDKNVSPFNIGQKIYLENFDRGEFEEFLDRAGLQGNQVVNDTVFDWTSGNPRMTWDICSELENIKESGVQLERSHVDAVVERLYFREFDRAPIDHIRTLVESDPQIRDAIVSLRYGKGAFISNKLKSRLYLSGITNAAGGNNIEIANRIVDAALSDDWLESLAAEMADPFISARRFFEAHEYGRALKEFEGAIRGGVLGEEGLPPADRLALGLCYLNVGQRDDAIRELSSALKTRKEEWFTQQVSFYLAVAYMGEMKLKEAVELLDVARAGPDEDICQHATLEKIDALLRLGTALYVDKALALSKQIIGDLRVNSIANPLKRHRLVSALYARATVHLAMKRRVLASQDLQDAIAECEGEVPVVVLLCQYDLAANNSTKKEIARQLVNVIVEAEYKVEAVHDLHRCLNHGDLAKVFSILNEHELDDEFDALTHYYRELLADENSTSFTILMGLLTRFSETEDLKRYYGLVIGALRVFKHEATSIELQRAYRIVALSAPGGTAPEYMDMYLSELRNSSSHEPMLFDMEDASALAYIAIYLRSYRSLHLVRQYIAVWGAYRERFFSISQFWTISLDSIQMEFLRALGATREAQAIAQFVLDATDPKELGESLQEYDLNLVMHARQTAAKLLKKKVESVIPLRELDTDPYKGIRRNQRVRVQYKDGAVLEKKFKTVEHELRNGLCTLLDVVSE